MNMTPPPYNFTVNGQQHSSTVKPETYKEIGINKKGLYRDMLDKNHNLLIRDGTIEYITLEKPKEPIKIQAKDILARISKQDNQFTLTLTLYLKKGKCYFQVEIHSTLSLREQIAEKLKAHL